MRIPTDREPTHPGEMLRAEFLQPMGISQRELAEAIHVPYQRVNELVNQKRGVTPSTALRLAKFFNVSADYWLNLQSRWDLYWAQQSEKDDLESIADFSQVKKLACNALTYIYLNPYGHYRNIRYWKESLRESDTMPQLAKLSHKGQVTVPVELRKRLQLKAGDTLAWEVQKDGKISVHRVEPVDADYLSALNGALSEWSSAEDDEAYRNL